MVDNWTRVKRAVAIIGLVLLLTFGAVAMATLIIRDAAYGDFRLLAFISVIGFITYWGCQGSDWTDWRGH